MADFACSILFFLPLISALALFLTFRVIISCNSGSRKAVLKSSSKTPCLTVHTTTLREILKQATRTQTWTFFRGITKNLVNLFNQKQQLTFESVTSKYSTGIPLSTNAAQTLKLSQATNCSQISSLNHNSALMRLSKHLTLHVIEISSHCHMAQGHRV